MSEACLGVVVVFGLWGNGTRYGLSVVESSEGNDVWPGLCGIGGF